MKRSTAVEESINYRKEKIVLTAAELFLRRGMENVRMNDIAEEAGIGVASLYRYFKTKTAIAIEAGTILWQDLERLFDDSFTRDEYEKKTGLEQIELQFEFLLKFYKERKDFIAFLDSFDRLILSENVDINELSEYEKSVVDLKEQFMCACKKGVEDKSIRKLENFEVIYLSVAHALTALAEKFVRGKIMPGDDFSYAEKELRCICNMTIEYIKKEN